MNKIFNKLEIKEKRKSLRKLSPEPELILWSKLRNRQLSGYKFKRQFSINKFIVDFYCPELRLVIEIDGDSHYRTSVMKYDKQRQKYIGSLGLRVVRYTNLDVMTNISGVLENLAVRISEKPLPTPPS